MTMRILSFFRLHLRIVFAILISLILLDETVSSSNAVHQLQKVSRNKRSTASIDDPLMSSGYFEGDIAGYEGKAIKRVSDGENNWPNQDIPFKFEQLDYVAQRAVMKSFNEFSKKTCIRFKNATASDTDYIAVISGIKCFSYIGMHGGRQELSVAEQCENVGSVLHLLMHALGFWHEQSRIDRDNFVLINEENITPANKKNFGKYYIKIANYDYDSITHISPYAFAMDKSKTTILPKDERFQIGQRFELSEGDVAAVKKRYCGRRVSQMSEKELLQIKREEEEWYRQNSQDRVVDNLSVGQEEESGGGDFSDVTKGCSDLSKKCPLWATQGMCYKQRQNMIVNCPASCLTCDYTPECKNGNSLCGMWAWMGHCVGKRALQVLKLCPLACGVCLPEGTNERDVVSAVCRDKHEKCRQWGQEGRCFYQHVVNLCPVTCRTCGTDNQNQDVLKPTPAASCKDRDRNCAQWKRSGQCNVHEIREKCPKSCDVCQTAVTPVTPFDACKDVNPVLCQHLKSTSSVACLVDTTAKACMKTCGHC